MGRSSSSSSALALVPVKVKKDMLSKKDQKLKSVKAKQDTHGKNEKAIPMHNKPGKDSGSDVEKDPNRNGDRREDKSEWKNFKKYGLGTMTPNELQAYQKMGIALKTAVRKVCQNY